MAGDEGAFRLVVGLGNPGRKYEGTRHNAGFWLVDELLHRFGGELREQGRFHGAVARVAIDGYDCRLLEPSTYMNHSGRSVAALASFFKIPAAQVLVAHDEIDLPPGGVRLKRGGGHGGHNGLRDIQSALGTAEFARLRLGVGHPGHRDEVIPYVLTRPSPADRQRIDAAVAEAAGCLPQLLAGQWDRACQRLHTGVKGG